MGLQGWDVSFMFQNGDNGVSATVSARPLGCHAPNVLGVFPPGRQVLRGDVAVSPSRAVFVDLPSLDNGKLGFRIRSISSTTSRPSSDAVPATALAAVPSSNSPIPSIRRRNSTCRNSPEWQIAPAPANQLDAGTGQ
jgi:hypothetical protein